MTYSNIQIRSLSSNASAPAANSDGWDIYRSSHVTITDSTVDNGDDCVSFKPNSTYITVTNMDCNGSHGISVGSLGQYYGQTDIVANVFVRNISMANGERGEDQGVWRVERYAVGLGGRQWVCQEHHVPRVQEYE